MNTFTAQTENYVGNTASRVSNGIQVYTVYTGLKEAMYCIRYMYTGINGISLTLINRYIDVRFFPVWIIPLHQNIGRAVYQHIPVFLLVWTVCKLVSVETLAASKEIQNHRSSSNSIKKKRVPEFLEGKWKLGLCALTSSF